MGKSCGRNGEQENTQVIGGKAIRRETTRRPDCRWVDNIMTDPGETGQGGVEWIYVA
jgi:hypothetical protein